MLNITIENILNLSPFMSFITWGLTSIATIVTILYIRRQWIKLGLDIDEKRRNKPPKNHKSKISQL